MAWTYILLLWMELLKGSFIEARIPIISRSYSAWPSIRSYSKSVAPPFLTATPCLSVFPNLCIAPIIPSPDVGFIPKPTEITQKTSVILHKVHKNSENETILTLKLVKENDDDVTKENLECNDDVTEENLECDDDVTEENLECDDDVTEENLECDDDYIDENISYDDIQDDLLLISPVDNETEIENETGTEDFLLENYMINEDIPVENITINENKPTDSDNDATEDILTDEYE